MFYLVENIDTIPYLAISPAAGTEEVLIQQRLVEFETITTAVEGEQGSTEQPIRPLKKLPGVFSEHELPAENEQGVYTKVLNETGTAFISTPQDKLDAASRTLQREALHHTIATSKQYLQQTDYIILKKAEGVLNDTQLDTQYPSVLEKREAARIAINQAEMTLQTLNTSI